ncbi:MAG TPA: hypothetical protein VFE62_10075 [Gemmataceae bacterium]|nr:hypothetical protein [Gemmataceae bacterium]
MSPEVANIEQRLVVVESALADLQKKLGLALPSAHWVEEVSGSLADIPEDDYKQFLECCRAVRAEQPVEKLQP